MPRILSVAGGGGTQTTVVTLNPDFDNFAWRDTNDTLGGDEWTLGSASSTTFTVGYKDTLFDPAIHDYWYRAGLDFSFASIPTSATVTGATFHVTVASQDGTGGNFDVADKLGAGTFAGESDPQTFWDEANGGTSYGTLTNPVGDTITLNAAAVSAIQSLVTLGSGSLSISISETPALDTADVRRILLSREWGVEVSRPQLIVTYTTTSAVISAIYRGRFPRIRPG